MHTSSGTGWFRSFMESSWRRTCLLVSTIVSKVKAYDVAQTNKNYTLFLNKNFYSNFLAITTLFEIYSLAKNKWILTQTLDKEIPIRQTFLRI